MGTMSETPQSITADFVKAIAAGTFVYVGLVEVIVTEFGSAVSKEEKYWKAGALVLGMGSMSLLALWS